MCQKPVSSERINVCADCLDEYDLNPKPFDKWPGWAQFAMRNEWERRNRERRDERHEVFYNTFEDIEGLIDPETEIWPSQSSEPQS